MSEHPRDQRSAKNRYRLIILAAIILGLAIGILLGWLTLGLLRGDSLFGSPGYHGIEMPTPQPVADFSLTAQSGELVHLSDYRGKIVLLYYGYTYCPDVCPATMAELAKAMELLSREEREAIQVIMVSVDPGRDSPGTIAEYLAHFDPSFTGLTGSESEIAAAAAAIGIFYQKRTGSVESGYLIDHSSSVSVIDHNGDLKLVFKFGMPADEIAKDLQRLLKDS